MEVFCIFLGIPSLLFSETLQLVRACKQEKNVPSAFLKKFPFCPFWPISVQNWPFWSKMPKNGSFLHFSQSIHQNLLIFCTKPSLWSGKKKTFSNFWENSKMALFGQIWVIFDLTCQLYIACGFQSNLFILLYYVLIFPNFVSSYISILLNIKISSCCG